MSELLFATGEHLIIVALSMIVATLVGVGLGVLSYWKKRLGAVIITIAEMVQTIPSLALLALLMIIFGLGDLTMGIALVLYALLPIVRNTQVALTELPPAIIDAARGMGMSRSQRLKLVEIPLSIPMIFGGIKVALVNSLSIAVMGVLIGSGGLGYIIYRGIQQRNFARILIGAIPVVVIALFFDWAMTKIEQRLSTHNKMNKEHEFMSSKTIRIILAFTLVVTLLSGCAGKGSITVGSKDYSENILLGEIMAQLIEAKTDLKVNRKLNLGGTFVNFNAIQNKQIDLYPEYTGTALTAELKMDVINDPVESYRVVSEEMATRWDIIWLEPFGFNNTYTLAVTAEVQERYGLETYSDLVPVAEELTFGAEHEFFDRQDGFDGLVEHYGLSFKGEPMKLNTSLKYQAIGRGEMDVTDAFSTDGPIKQYDLRILEDDKAFFPPYHAAPVIRKAVLDTHPEVGEALSLLSGTIDDSTMASLNYLVDVKGEAVEQVASNFLASLGLV